MNEARVQSEIDEAKEVVSEGIVRWGNGPEAKYQLLANEKLICAINYLMVHEQEWLLSQLDQEALREIHHVYGVQGSETFRISQHMLSHCNAVAMMMVEKFGGTTHELEAGKLPKGPTVH